jgi:DNA (cytosine-5)-methyltransferase 1
MKPICFKTRGGGNYSGTKGGPVRSGKGGTGLLFYEDKTFTVATGTDQYIATSAIPNPMNHEQQDITLPEPQPIGKPLRYLSVCSGMEAASVAWHPLGWTPVGFSEIEPFPCAILKHRFPNTPNYGSLTEYQSWPLQPGSIDLLVGGTPCQSFSVAGLRKGLADPRGNLALTFLGLADKLKPKWIVWENVPGVLSSGGGRDFGSFLGALVELGYGFAYRVLDAQHFGVPQRRRRVFVVACLGDWRAAAEVLSLAEGLRGYLETGNKKRKSASEDAGASFEAGGVQSSYRQGFGTRANPDIASTLETTCNDYSRSDCFTAVVENTGSPKSHWEGGEIHPTLNQAHNIGSPGYSNQELFSQRGAGLVPTPYRKSKRACSTTDNESWVLANSSNTLNNFDLGDTRTTHAVVQHQMPGSVAPTIGASGPPYSRTGNERVEAEELAISFTPGNLVRKAGPNPSSETFPTLSKDSGHQNPHVATPMAVRRLTPIECERLQGFPDNWSRIPWKGNSEEECPDGPRYKACGNSMAVPVMAFIGKRIAEVEAKGHQS